MFVTQSPPPSLPTDSIPQKVFLYLGFTAAWYACWQFSVGLEVIPSRVSWFLPAGLRVAGLLFVRVRHWWLLWLAEITAILLCVDVDYNLNDLGYVAAGTVLPFPCYAITLLLASRFGARDTESLSYSPLRVNIAAVVSTVIDATLQNVNRLMRGWIEPDAFGDELLNFVLGNMVGVSMVLPLLWLVRESHARPRLPYILLGLSALAATLPVAIDFSDYGYSVKIALLVVLSVAIARAGLQGAVLGTFPVLVFILAAHFAGQPLGPMDQDQFYLIFITLGALTLGDAMSRNQLLTIDLRKRNRALQINLETLEHLNRQYQDLAARMVNVEEEERRRFSRELHDGLGQLLTGARIQLQVLAAQNSHEARQRSTAQLHNSLEAAYRSARQLMYALTPTPLLDMGLDEALSGDEISAPLAAAGITYQLEYRLGKHDLPPAAALHLYRIVQECATNTIRHAGASLLTVVLENEGDGVVMRVSDDGCGFDQTAARMGLGLENIRDRAVILGGEHQLQTSASGTTHELHVPVGSLRKFTGG
jgi:two-component system sensor histidine kinase UhpB